jgi:deazaflavin-dependent oxidoreductase (nitroreductase family)
MAERSGDWNQNVIDEFRANDGTVSTAGFGRALVLLHHVGAKSGQERVAPVMGIRQDPDTWLVAASKAGAPENPAWFHNLKAHPDVSIEVPGEGTVAVRARELTGDERDAGWAQFTARSPGFKQYEERTSRTIPVVALARREG